MGKYRVPFKSIQGRLIWSVGFREGLSEEVTFKMRLIQDE